MKAEKVYPRWIYHASKESMIVRSAEQEEELGSGWGEVPVAESEEVKEEKKETVKPTKGPKSKDGDKS